MQSRSSDLKAGRNGVKPPMHLVPLWALAGLARVQEYGDAKYAPGNWVHAADEGPGCVADYVAAALRHLGGCGTPFDPAALDAESGLPHLDHAITSLVFARGLAQLTGVLEQDPK